ncbi:hypothetical protein F511_32089 [Dorcoceras hygrometricum]|uniref:Uncharacterized protein n=1 Tax=Dorcoceras hygrometricum TaxID=472368 RepID=A0A2Z7C5I0_9LAMI|nr:hypothetical protein F511_32089 [Dorcoceras hygrometricum]
MASSLFVNTLQVDFESVFAIEHIGMTRMFKSLEDTALKYFLKGTTFVFENVVIEFFVNAKVIAGTIVSTVCNQKLIITEDLVSTTFKLPTEGIIGLGDIPKETIVEMSSRFSATDVPFRAPSKKREMQIEYRLLHDIVAVTIRYCPANLCTQKNQDITPAGESSKRIEDTASNTEGGETQLEQPAATETLDAAKVKWVDNPKKRYTTDAGQKRKTKKATEMAKQMVEKPSVEAGSQVAPTNLDYETSSDKDSCPLVTRRRRRSQVTEPSDSEDTSFAPFMVITKKRRTMCTKTAHSSIENRVKFQPRPVTRNPLDDIDTFIAEIPEGTLAPTTANAFRNIRTLNADDWQNTVTEQCQLILDNSWDVNYFRIEETLLSLAETEEIKELVQRRSLLSYKLYELELQKLFNKNMAHFTNNAPSSHHDFLRPRFLHKALKDITSKHRDQRALAGLPTTVPEGLIIRPAPVQSPLLALEFSSLADQAQAVERTKIQQIVQQINENSAMTSPKHQAQANEPPIEHQGSSSTDHCIWSIDSRSEAS